MLPLACLESSKWASFLSSFILEQTFRGFVCVCVCVCVCVFVCFGFAGGNINVWDISKVFDAKSVFQGIRVVWFSPVKYV